VGLADPGVLKGLLGSQAMRRVQGQQPADQVLHTATESHHQPSSHTGNDRPRSKLRGRRGRREGGYLGLLGDELPDERRAEAEHARLDFLEQDVLHDIPNTS
jgi:hypothetical protein